MLNNSPDVAVHPAAQPAGTEQQFDLHSTAALSSLLSFTGHLMRQCTLSMPAEWQSCKAQLDLQHTPVSVFRLMACSTFANSA